MVRTACSSAVTPGKSSLPLHDLQRHARGHVLGDGHRLVGRAVEAGRGLGCAGRAAQLRAAPDVVEGLAEQPWPGACTQRPAAVRAVDAAAVRLTDTTSADRFVISGRPWSSSTSPRTAGRDDLPDAVGRRGRLVALRPDDLRRCTAGRAACPSATPRTRRRPAAASRTGRGAARHARRSRQPPRTTRRSRAAHGGQDDDAQHDRHADSGRATVQAAVRGSSGRGRRPGAPRSSSTAPTATATSDTATADRRLRPPGRCQRPATAPASP